MAVARQRQELVVGETGVPADLGAEVDAELTADHLLPFEFDEVLEPPDQDDVTAMNTAYAEFGISRA